MDLTPFENMQDDPDNLLSERISEKYKNHKPFIVLLHGNTQENEKISSEPVREHNKDFILRLSKIKVGIQNE